MFEAVEGLVDVLHRRRGLEHGEPVMDHRRDGAVGVDGDVFERVLLAHAHVDVVIDEFDALLLERQERLAGVGVGLPGPDFDHAALPRFT